MHYSSGRGGIHTYSIGATTSVPRGNVEAKDGRKQYRGLNIGRQIVAHRSGILRTRWVSTLRRVLISQEM